MRTARLLLAVVEWADMRRRGAGDLISAPAVDRDLTMRTPRLLAFALALLSGPALARAQTPTPNSFYEGQTYQSPGFVSGASGSAAALVSVTTVPASGATQSLAMAASGDRVLDVTLAAATTFGNLTGGSSGQLQRLILYIRQPASGTTYAPTLPTNCKWAAGSAPVVSTAAGSITRLVFETDDGVTYLGGV